MRGLLEDALAFLLRHTSDDGEYLSFAGSALELVEPVEHFLLGLIADTAGIVENQSGGLGTLDLRIAAMNQRSDDLLGIVGVHLTAEGLDVERLFSHYGLILGTDN